MAIRLIALDLDGTLLTSEKTISPGDRAAVEEAIARGVVVVLVTGRPAQGVPQEVLDLPGVRYVVSSNGATIRDVITGEFLLETHLAAETALEVLAASDHVPMIREAFRAGVGYLSQEDYDVLCARYEGAMLAYVLDTRQVVPGTLADFLRDDPRPIEELFFLTDSEETKLDLQRTLSALPGIAFADPFPRDLEVMAGGIDKGGHGPGGRGQRPAHAPAGGDRRGHGQFHPGRQGRGRLGHVLLRRERGGPGHREVCLEQVKGNHRYAD